MLEEVPQALDAGKEALLRLELVVDLLLVGEGPIPDYVGGYGVGGVAEHGVRLQDVPGLGRSRSSTRSR